MFSLNLIELKRKEADIDKKISTIKSLAPKKLKGTIKNSSTKEDSDTD